MRSALQTQGDSRSRSGPVSLVPRPSMALMLLALAGSHKILICMHIYMIRRGLGLESAYRWPTSQEAGGARQTTQRDNYKRRSTMPLSRIVRLGRLGMSEEIVVVFLPSDDRSYVTGTELFVDGGFAQV